MRGAGVASSVEEGTSRQALGEPSPPATSRQAPQDSHPGCAHTGLLQLRRPLLHLRPAAPFLTSASGPTTWPAHAPRTEDAADLAQLSRSRLPDRRECLHGGSMNRLRQMCSMGVWLFMVRKPIVGWVCEWVGVGRRSLRLLLQVQQTTTHLYRNTPPQPTATPTRVYRIQCRCSSEGISAQCGTCSRDSTNTCGAGWPADWQRQ